jgi:hypothetical protein
VCDAVDCDDDDDIGVGAAGNLIKGLNFMSLCLHS